MSRFVLDASVAAKWFLPRAHETLVDESLRLLSDYTVGKVSLMAPDLFWAEMGNILWKSVRNGRISATSAKGAIIDLESLHLTAVPAGELLGDAFDIAAAFDRTVYDSLYVALAIAADAPLVTADERLVKGLGSRFPVLWLGAYAGAN